MASKNCQHQIRSYCKQAKLLDEEVMEQFNDFYVDSSKQRQDQFILNFIALMPINATIWKRCPKERAFSASSVKRAVHLAAISWNCGNSCYENMLHSLGLGCNYFTKKVMNAKNNRRLSEAAKTTYQKET